MDIKGGYKIVDFNGAALSGTAVVISGIYNQIADNYKKPVLVSGVSLNGVVKDDAFTSADEGTGSVTLNVYGGTITVTDDDKVTYTASEGTAELEAKIGDLDDLKTTDTGSLVDAVNEVVGNVGDLIHLDTFEKGSLVDAVNEVLAGLSGVNGTNIITSTDDLTAVGETDKIRIVRFTASFNSTYFGENAMSAGILSDSGQAILIASFSDEKIITGVYQTVLNNWVVRTVTPLTAYTPA